MSNCERFQPNPMNENNICRKCFEHKDNHPPLPPVEAYHKEKECRRKIEDILYFGNSQQDTAGADSLISILIKNPPPPEEYFKIFNVYSFVRQNLTNAELRNLSPEGKMLAIYKGVDFLLLVSLPLRRPQYFEKVAKLRRSELIEVEKLEGTHDVIKKLGYTVMTKEHYEFPLDVTQAPDQTLIREIIADLRIALEEIKCYNYVKHPYPERFTEGDWAKKTSPILPEINKDLKKFAEIIDKIKHPPGPQTPRRTGTFIIPDPQLPPHQQIPPGDFSTRYPHPTPVTNPSGSMSSQGDFETSYSQMVDQFPQKIDLETKIPPPVPENMIVCPVPTCKNVLPKNSAVCPKCRMFLTIPSSNDLIPLDKWTCNNCTYTNTTARGRSRVCEMCTHSNNTSQSEEPSPNSSVEHTMYPKPSLPNPVQPPNTQPFRNYDTKPFEQERDSNVDSGFRSTAGQKASFHINQSMKNPSMHPLHGQREAMNPYLDQSIYGTLNHTMDQPMTQTIQPRDSQMLPPNYPTYETRDQAINPNLPHTQQVENPYEIVNEYPQRTQGYNPVPENQYHYDKGLSIGPGTHPESYKRYPSYPSQPTQRMPPPPNIYNNPYPQNIPSPLNDPPIMQPPPPLPPYKRIKQIIIQNQGFKDEAIRLAIQTCGPNDCIRWLQTDFHGIINMLTEDVRKYPLCQFVTADTVEENYLACQGKIINVPTRIQEGRQKKLEELMESLHVNQRIATSSLDDTNWDVQAASENISLLCNEQNLDNCRPFLWSGGMTIQDKQLEEIDPALWEQFMLLSENIEEMSDKVARKFICELKIPTLVQLNLLLHLVVAEETKSKEPKDLVQAVQEISEFDAALKFLNQECPICYEYFTANEMIQMFFCNHMCCKSCVSDHFTDVVRNAAIKKWTCFQCEEPDISQMDDPSDYFGLLSNVVQAICEPEIAGLFHQKVNEFYFSKRPEFRWCPHCHSGFLGQEGEGKLRCPQEECNQYMCYVCKRKWEAEHEGVTCEEYQQWREANDRDILDKGLAARMVEEGIECPSCKFKYELARGGCMHFRCTQCPAEFCSGCFRLFKKDNCTKFVSCAKKGLHAHHPRNCQYFTRDMDILKMKELLEMGGFQRDEAVQEPPLPEGAQANPVKKKQLIYKVKVPEEHRNAVVENLKNELGDAYAEPPQGELKIPCQIVEFKDSPDKGYEKDHCSKSSFEKDGYAGLCDKHYKEYLCGLITKAGLDPIDVLQVTEDNIFELFAILRRNEIPFDDKMKGDELKQLIKQKLPLEPMSFKGALQV